ncbi:MAG: hypothetical protein WDZ85_00645 [Candidatus Paceibacterota bacterium]
MRKILLSLMSLVLVFGLANVVGADVNAVTPSTNDINRTNGWAHVNQVSVGVGTTNLEFVSTRSFWSCFEYRTDGDTSQILETNGGDNYNPAVTDGLYPYVCVNNETKTKTIEANEYVEVRMVFGAETDERFDWTRFDVLYPRSAEITAPEPAENVSGMVNFEAYLDDDDEDSIQWAVREGTCAAGINTVFGNVDGKSDVATIDTSDLSNQTFSFTGDMSTMTPGEYCFIYNPKEDSGESNIRKTVEFNLIEPLTEISQCKKDGWMTFNNPPFKNQGDCVSYIKSSPKATGNKNK